MPWMEELVIFLFFFQSISLKIPIFPQGTGYALVFWFSVLWKEAGKGKKNGTVDRLDFTSPLLLSQVWPTQQL